MAKRPGGAMTQGNSLPTRSQLIPILTKWKDLRSRKEQMAPFLFCIVVFFLLNSFGSESWIVVKFGDANGNLSNPLGWIYTSNLLIITSLFLTLASLFLIYRLVGKSKSWWILIGVMAFTAYFLWRFRTQDDFSWLYDLFHKDLAGGEASDNGPFISLLVNNIVGTGFFEEFVKAIPVLIVALATMQMPLEMRHRFGIEEPLDGILLGAASGGGFAVVETLGQYVSGSLAKLWFKTGFLHAAPALVLANPKLIPPFIASLTNTQKFSFITVGYNLLGTSPGMKSTIVRSIDLAFGHMAFAGYFGYFIGLAVIKPQKRWLILGVGLVSAAIPHALWDSILEGTDIPPLVAACALLCFAVLAAAILKAREISPNRAILQPSILAVPGVPAAAPVPACAPPPIAAVPQPAAAGGSLAPVGSAAAARPSGGNQLRIGARQLVIVPGLRLLHHQIPGLSPQASGDVVAEVTRNPSDPGVLGLTNLSQSAWETTSGNGTQRTITSGQTIKLSAGMRINFGQIEAEVC